MFLPQTSFREAVCLFGKDNGIDKRQSQTMTESTLKVVTGMGNIRGGT